MKIRYVEAVDKIHICRGQRIFWGEPPRIVAAKMDRNCPVCGFSTRDIMGLELGIENGRIFGGMCFHCGWTF